MNLATLTTAAGPIPIVDAQMDRLVDEQARFRVVGTGPVSQRELVPATSATVKYAATHPRLEQAARDVLRAVEATAGGARASAGLNVNGVAFGTSQPGYAALTTRARLDDDRVLREQVAGMDANELRLLNDSLVQQSVAETNGTLANVVAGWMNLGPKATTTLLSPPGSQSSADAADVVRIVAHESVHLADQTRAGLSDSAESTLMEAMAEKRSTTLPSLQRARAVLGFDGAVSDDDLAAALQRIRPYGGYEQRLDAMLGIVGIRGNDAASLFERTGADVAAALQRALARGGTSASKARQLVDDALASAPRDRTDIEIL